MRHLEDSEQALFFSILRYRYPQVWDIAFHVPNGGKRNAREGARLKAQGVKAGVPDIFVPMPVGSHFGLFIEMKRALEHGKPKPVVSGQQRMMMDMLTAQGYKCVVAYGADDAIMILEQYLKGMVVS